MSHNGKSPSSQPCNPQRIFGLSVCQQSLVKGTILLMRETRALGHDKIWGGAFTFRYSHSRCSQQSWKNNDNESETPAPAPATV
eukprot:scaffold18251_cov65-Cyclotella_meneghiniana.AAC.6